MAAQNFNRWQPQDEVEALRNQLGAFCTAAEAISAEFPPPAVNAANGRFATEMNDRQSIKDAIMPREHYTDPEVVALYGVTNLFFNSLRGAFSAGTHKASVFTSPGAFLQYLTQLAPQIEALATDIFTAASLDPAAIATAAGKIKADYEALVKAVGELGVKFDGEHANGYIASGVQGAAVQTLGALASLNPARQDSQAYAGLLKTVCEKLKAIELHEYRPWLNAEWQVQFEAIVKSTSQAIAAT